VGLLVALKDVRKFLERNLVIVKEAGVRWSDDACYRMGASLAFYTLFSIFPLLLVAVAGLGLFLGDDPASRERLVASVANILSAPSRALLDDTLKSMQSHQTAGGVGALVGAATLVFGASGAFSELETSLNTIWRVKVRPAATFGTTMLRALEDKATSFAAVAATGVVLLGSLLVGMGLGALGRGMGLTALDLRVWQGIESLVSLGLATLLFAILFRVLPRADIAWRDVLGAAFLTALLFGIMRRVLAWYLEHIGSYAAYGAVGGVLALLMWIYLMSLLLFFGAEVARVYAEREGSLAGRGGGELTERTLAGTGRS
jgi:membrane protein